MASDRSGIIGQQKIHNLTSHEIDRRIERLVDEVAGLSEERERDEDPRHPFLIAPAELIRQLRQFIVYN